MPGDYYAHIAYVGIIVQAASALLLAILFLSLRRFASHRPYLRDWSVAFVGLAVAITALFVHYFSFFSLPDAPGEPGRLADGTQPLARALFITYQAGKLTFFAALVTGAVRFTGRSLPIERWTLVALLAVYAVGSVILVVSLNNVVIWQTPIAIAATATAALLLFFAPRPSRTLGTRITASVCLLLALLWTLYARSFTFQPTGGWLDRVMPTLNRYNSFVDVVMQSVLSVGMVIALFQDLEREAEAARTERAALHVRLAESRHLESLGVVVSGVAHELNNPLTAILGFSEELLDPAWNSPDPSRAGRIIHEQAQRCRSIVRDLLGFSRPRPPVREAVAPAALIERVVRGFEPAARRAQVQVDVELAPSLRELDADPTGLEQVLANLIDNAVDASPPGSAIRLAARDRDGRCEIVVEDEGAGLPSAVAERVFEPFFTTKRPGQGTGLGLAVTHRIVTAHGGSIRCGAREDGRSGARFVVTLPHRDPVAASASRAAPATSESDSNPGLDGPIRLLVVDDEPQVRALLRRRFELEGWEVVEADGERAALDQIGEPGARFDAVILDLRLRGVPSLALYEQMARASPRLARRVVAITDDLLAPDVATFVAASRSPVFEKPLQLDRVAGGVAALVGREISRSAAGSA